MQIKQSFLVMGLCTALFTHDAHAETVKPGQVIISEFITSNETGLKDEDGDLSDWIELWNPSGNRIDLKGCYLTDDPTNLTQWKLPELQLENDQRHVVFASGKNRNQELNALHTNFSLNTKGEYLALVGPDGISILDEYTPTYPKQKNGVAFGVPSDWQKDDPRSKSVNFLLTPTPGKPNAETASGKVNSVKWSHHRGFYEAPFKLKLRTSTSSAEIRYTTDGSIPTRLTGTVYKQPIQINQSSVLRVRAFKKGKRPSNLKTHTFLFLKDVIRQSPDGLPPEGFPFHWGQNAIDYGMDPTIVNDPAYAEEIIEGLKSLPSYSVVTDMEHLFDLNKGIYANAHNDGREWERPASVELLHADGSDGFQIDCGIRIRGGFSRRPQNPKHAFRLFFRDEYGEAKLKYPLFGEDGAKEYDNLDLRCSSNYSWHMGDSKGTMIRDQINRDLQAALGHPSMRGYFCHLYINGHYWGLYNTCERPKAGYGASYFDGKKGDFDAVKVSKGRGGIMATDGTLDAWRRVYDMARRGLEDNADYFKLQGLLPDGTPDPKGEVLVDVDNVIDYAMVILDAAITWFGGDRWHNNWHALRNRNGSEGFKFFIWDAEHTFLVDGMSVGLHEDRTGPFPAGQQFESSNPQWLWQQCLDNQEFQMRAADRIYQLYYGNGLLTPDAVRKLVMKRVLEVQSAVICESARWGDAARADEPMTRDDHWKKEIDRILNTYIPQRSDIVLAQLFRQGILPDFEPAKIRRQNRQVTLSSPKGSIYYTLDGNDPRKVGGGISSTAKEYRSSFAIDGNTRVKARVLFQGEWSVLTQSQF